MALSAANIVESVYNDRVLLMEPDETLRTVYEEHLEFGGFEVHVASSVAEAINVLEYVPVNLIVTNEIVGGESLVSYMPALRKGKIKSPVLMLSEDEDRVWDAIPPEEIAFHTFPIPKDLDEFFRTDINQFVAVINMVLDGMKGVLVVNDAPAETIAMENLLINNGFRSCARRDGLQGLDSIEKAGSTRTPISAIVMDIVNRYHPGFMFLEDLAKHQIQLPVIVTTSMKIDKERVDAKTNYEIHSIMHRKHIDDQLVQALSDCMGG